MLHAYRNNFISHHQSLRYNFCSLVILLEASLLTLPTFHIHFKPLPLLSHYNTTQNKLANQESCKNSGGIVLLWGRIRRKLFPLFLYQFCYFFSSPGIYLANCATNKLRHSCGFHATYLLLLFHFLQNSRKMTNFNKIFQHQISLKYIQWVSFCYKYRQKKK